MSEQTGEISTQFVPSLPKKVDLGAASLPQKEIGPETQPPEVRAQELFDLLLDKTELEISIHQQTKLLPQVEPSSVDVQSEMDRMKKIEITQGSPSKKGETVKFKPWEGKSDEELQRVAEERLRRKNLNGMREKVVSSDEELNKLTADKEAEKVESGDLSISELSRSVLAGDINEETLSEESSQLKVKERKIQELMQDEQVVEAYKNFRNERIAVLRKAREVSQGKSLIKSLELRQERMARQIFLDKRGYSKGEEEIIKRNRKVTEAVQKRIDNLTSDPEVFDQVRLRDLRELQEGLKTDRFGEVPSRSKLLSKIRNFWAQGRKVLATGPTGGGKTELFKHASQTLFGKDLEIVGGHELLTPYEIYGKPGGKTDETGKTQLKFISGPLVRAIDNDGPVEIDEINTIPNKVMMRVKPDLNARIGQTITIQEENGVRHTIGENFAVGASANVKSEKHPDREKLDPALVRMFEPLYVDYIPAHELYDLMIASQMDVKGGLKLSSKDDLNAITDLCVAAQWIQEAYQGKQVVTSETGKTLEARSGVSTGKTPTLREAVLDSGRALDLLTGWEDARTKGQTLREFANDKIVAFINDENYPEEDRYYLTEIFALRRFLKGTKVEELKVSGLSQNTLDSWSGFEGKRVKATEYYVKPEVVAKLDPFGVLERPGGEATDDLLGEDQLEEFEEGESEVEKVRTPMKVNKRRAGVSEMLEPVTKDYPDFSKLSDSERFANVPDMVFAAVKAEPSSVNEAAEILKELIDTQPRGQRAGLAPPRELGQYLSAIYTVIEAAAEAGDKKSLVLVSSMVTKISEYNNEYDKVSRPTYYPESRDDVYLDGAIDKIKAKLKAAIELK